MINFYTYIYLDPRKSGSYTYGDCTFEFEPFYVGKGKGQQYISHLREARNKEIVPKYSNPHKFYKIKNILKENLEPVILKVKDKILEQEAFEFEIKLIKEIGRFDLKLGPLTNHTDGGEGSINVSEEARKKMSEAQKGKVFSEEHKRKMSEAQRGEKNHMFGKNHTEESKRKQSESQKCENHPLFGKHHTEESKRKMSETNKGKEGYWSGKKMTEEHKKKISISLKDPSEETRHKMSNSHKGRTHSEETKRKMSESQLRR